MKNQLRSQAILSRAQLLRLAYVTLLDVRTILRVYRGIAVHEASWRGVRDAAEELEYTLPPDHHPVHSRRWETEVQALDLRIQRLQQKEETR
jgi:hypothetical protein